MPGHCPANLDHTPGSKVFRASGEHPHGDRHQGCPLFRSSPCERLFCCQTRQVTDTDQPCLRQADRLTVIGSGLASRFVRHGLRSLRGPFPCRSLSAAAGRLSSCLPLGLHPVGRTCNVRLPGPQTPLPAGTDVEKLRLRYTNEYPQREAVRHQEALEELLAAPIKS